MPYKNTAYTPCIYLWDAVNGAPKTGDAANITLRGVGDGSEFTPSSPSITEVDSTNLKGVYKFSLTAGENNYSFVLIGGVSSSTGIVVQPVQWQNEISVTSSAVASVTGAVGSVTGAVGSVTGLTAANLDVAVSTRTKPADTQARVTLVDTLTTYTGNTVQTGDSYARIGATGSGLTTLATAAQATAIQADTDDIQTRLPAALTAGGNIKADALKLNGATPNNVAATDIVSAGAITTSAGKVSEVILVDTTTTLTNAPGDTSGVTTLLSRLSALRAGYLDNLSAGAVALEASLQGLITTVGAAGAGLTAIATQVWAAVTRTITGTVTLADGSLTEAKFAADTTKYQAKVWMTDDNSGVTDRYTVCWFKNGEPVLSGITSPTIQVIKDTDGSNLVASTAMTQIGSSGMYRYTEATNRIVDGAAYIATATATIGGSTRTWEQPISRDSS